jgi:hypothetical protein
MSGIQRPFPGLASTIQQPSTSSSITQLTNSNSIGIPTSSYLANYSNVNQTTNSTYMDDQTNLNRHFPNLDPSLASIDLGVPTQFQTTTNSTNSYYPSQRTHTSPSATTSFSQLFGYVPPSFNHHHHHHHLSSNVDDASLLIQNPSLT